jgi:hypothetical protein
MEYTAVEATKERVRRGGGQRRVAGCKRHE